MATTDKETQLNQEREELNHLIGKGVTFTVDDVRIRVEKRWFGLRKKRIPETYKRTFKIEEPTLGTLDRLSREWVELETDEEKLKSSDAMKAARTLVTNHAMRCCRIVALAVMGSDFLIPHPMKHGGVRYTEDVARLDELTRLFARTIKPSTLHHLCVLISAMCNLGDFCNSIRLMQTERTTTPIRIEENNVG